MLSLLGLCARAGKLISGEKTVINAVRAGNACVVVLDSAASANAIKAVTDSCTYYDIKLIQTEPNALGDAVGKPGRMAAAVTDKGFADSLVKLSGGK